MASAITLNGVTFYAKDIEESIERVGKDIQAANGARRFAYRARKRVWKITFDGITITVLNQLRTVHGLTTTFTYVDENAVSYTVFCGADALQNARPVILQNGDIEYTATLTIREA